jgi:hypothetical protein
LPYTAPGKLEPCARLPDSTSTWPSRNRYNPFAKLFSYGRLGAFGSSQSPGFRNKYATADGRGSADSNPSTPNSEDRPAWTEESTVNALARSRVSAKVRCSSCEPQRMPAQTLRRTLSWRLARPDHLRPAASRSDPRGHAEANRHADPRSFDIRVYVPERKSNSRALKRPRLSSASASSPDRPWP